MRQTRISSKRSRSASDGASARWNRAVPLESAELTVIDEAGLLGRFGQAHQHMYTFGNAHRDPVEIVSFRLGAQVAPGEIPKLASDVCSRADVDTSVHRASRDPPVGLSEHRVQVYENGAYKLRNGHRSRGVCTIPA